VPATPSRLRRTLLALILLALPAVANRAVLLAPTPHAAARELWGLNPFPESIAIARHIARTSAPGERLFVVGSEPQIFFYAERPSATRYIFFYPLMGDYPGVLERQRGVAAEVDAVKPRYIVWSNIATSLMRAEGTEPFILKHAQAMIARDYRLEFVAHPVSSGERFEFVYGVQARQLMRRARNRAEAAQWIALYRRR